MHDCFVAACDLPWLSRHSHGDSNVTSGAATAVLQRKTIANVLRIIATRSYHFVIALWSAKQTESAA
jgi:hypothetical protein